MAEEVILWVTLGFILGLFLDYVYKAVKRSRKQKTGKKVKRVVTDDGETREVTDSEEELNEDGSKKVREETLFAEYPIREVKLMLVVRDDLKMGKGKIGA